MISIVNCIEPCKRIKNYDNGDGILVLQLYIHNKDSFIDGRNPVLDPGNRSRLVSYIT